MKKYVIKIFKIILFSLFLFCLSGCALIGFDAQDLISPPTSNDDQQAIYALLSEVDESLNFSYPTSGDYRSAVILKDLDADGIDEAIGFIEDPSGGIVVQFMNETDNVWTTISSFENSGIQIDRVLFADFTGDGHNEVIVGWGSTASLIATVSVFVYSDDGVTEHILDTNYNEMIITDFDGDEVNELFITTVFAATEEEGAEDMPAIGKLYKFDDENTEEPYIVSSIILNSSVIRYTTLVFDTIYFSVDAVVIDGVSAEGNTITQAIYLNESNRLVSFLQSTDYLSEFNSFTRPSSLNLTPTDINDDDTIEFPYIKNSSLIGDEDYYDNLNYYVDWIRFNSEGYRVSNSFIINTTDNFTMEYSSALEISCEYNEDRTYYIKQYTKTTDGEILKVKILFMIVIFTEEEWEDVHQSLYTELFTTSEGKVYTAIVYDDDIEDMVESISPIIP